MGVLLKCQSRKRKAFRFSFTAPHTYILHILNPDIFTRALFLLQSGWKQHFSCFQNIFDFSIFYLPVFCLLTSRKRCWFRYCWWQILSIFLDPFTFILVIWFSQYIQINHRSCAQSGKLKLDLSRVLIGEGLLSVSISTVIWFSYEQ